MYDLDCHPGETLDRPRIKDWCLKNLSTSEFGAYLDLGEKERQLFEEGIWRGAIEGYKKGYNEGMGILEEDPIETGPSRSQSGPGLDKIEQEEWNSILG